MKRDDESSTGSLDDLDSIAGEVREKAACNDEDEAVSEDWDIWLVNNYTSESEKPPLICSGNYDAERHGKLFEGLRNLLIRRYRKNVLQSFLRYLRLEYYADKNVKLLIKGHSSPIRVPKWTCQNIHTQSKEVKVFKTELGKDLEVGRDAVGRAANASWWNWDIGSTLFFWRWPKWSKHDVRDGIKLFVDWSRMPNY